MVRCVHWGLLGAIVNRWRGANEKEEIEVDGAEVLLRSGGLSGAPVVIFEALNHSSVLSELRKLLVYRDRRPDVVCFLVYPTTVIAQTNRAILNP